MIYSHLELCFALQEQSALTTWKVAGASEAPIPVFWLWCVSNRPGSDCVLLSTHSFYL